MHSKFITATKVEATSLYSVFTSHRGQVVSAAPSSASLDIYIALWSSRLSSTVASMTQHVYRVVAKLSQQRRCQYDSVETSCHGQVGLIAPRQYDSATTSYHSQHRLDNAITSMTRQLLHATVNIGSVASSPV
jgi:hypothetical protein